MSRVMEHFTPAVQAAWLASHPETRYLVTPAPPAPASRNSHLRRLLPTSASAPTPSTAASPTTPKMDPALPHTKVHPLDD